jgi:hypothetical protein
MSSLEHIGHIVTLNFPYFEYLSRLTRKLSQILGSSKYAFLIFETNMVGHIV